MLEESVFLSILLTISTEPQNNLGQKKPWQGMQSKPLLRARLTAKLDPTLKLDEISQVLD